VDSARQPTTIGAAFLALTNSVFAAGTLLGVWSLTAEEVAALQLVLGNVVIVVTLLAVRQHTVSLTENREQVAEALVTPPPAG
jgi:hypothetical protein